MFRVTVTSGRACKRTGNALLKPALFLVALTFATNVAADGLTQPAICSAIGAGALELQYPFCRVSPIADKPGQHDVTLSLSATTSPIYVGGYRLSETDNYNGSYVPTTVELKPGDRLKVRLLNTLVPTKSAGAKHGAGHGAAGRSTNLHTHGLIVSARNARPELPQNGDNVFVSLDRGQSLDYSIEIPTALPASLLDGKSGIIPHPSGPFWYHSHQHGVSAAQVAGGMSGLLSIGPRDANLVATEPAQTAALRARTDVSYLMLRDIQITSATAPLAANGASPAIWADDRDSKLCEPDASGVVLPPIAERNGYCQDPKDKNRIWLFTVNGQRFPTVRVPSGRNGLWRVANLSANVTYVISLRDGSGNAVAFDLLSVDGIVPGTPTAFSGMAGDSPEATKIKEKLLLMPAARAEIFIENDNGDTTERRFVLQTNGLDTSKPGTKEGDPWPEVKLAEVILEAASTAVASAARVGLNVAVALPSPLLAPAITSAATASSLPPGCVRDIDANQLEHRRISFRHPPGVWKMKIEIVEPADKTKLQHYDTGFKTVADTTIGPMSFEDYLKDGSVDWDATDGRPRHTCVRLGNGHGQLWELNNPTAELHNFHLHQTKFRLARDEDLKRYGIDPSSVRVKSGLQVKAFAESASVDRDVWHDTLPINAEETIFIVINFDAEEQLGRYVFHCHILEHEDEGLMAPMEVIR